jgi:hypothetical protein
MKRALALSLVFSLAAQAQSTPPLVPLEDEAPVEEPAPPPPVQPARAPGEQSPSYFDRCFALPAAAWVPGRQVPGISM